MDDPLSGMFESGDVLEHVGIDLTALARRGDLEPVRCRDAEIARVTDILLRQSKNNPALVGKAGVGKTAIAEGLAQRIAAGDVPPAMKDARIIALDHVALLAGTAFRGQYEDRVRRLVRALAADPDLILFVDELHNLIGQGTAMGVAMDAANMLKPALVRGDIRVIGATTGAEYDRWVRGDPALERRFQPVPVEELDQVQTWEVLVARRPRLERHHAVAISDDALKAAIVLTDKFITDRALPDKAIDVIDEACAHAQATAKVSPDLERLIRERRKLDATLRRAGSGAAEPAPDFAEVLDQVVEDFREMLGGGTRARSGAGAAPAAPPADAPRAPTPGERRTELDRLLRVELESQGLSVAGGDVARVVGAAVGKRIEWTP
ncbi:MAG TPA: AAA family ATPase [Gemmatimonadales bacterium]|nr:AAA family ATPase [Gemmatimonadales bacterium]